MEGNLGATYGNKYSHPLVIQPSSSEFLRPCSDLLEAYYKLHRHASYTVSDNLIQSDWAATILTRAQVYPHRAYM